MARAATPLPLTPEQRRILEAWRDAPQTPRQVAFRARLILLASAGVSSRGVARALRTTLVTVLFWRRRFHEGGLTALTATAPGRGPRRRITARKIRQIVQATLHTRPPEGRRWTIRSLARAQGVSPATVQRIWDLYGLKPRLAGRLQGVQAAVREVVGLYLNPPDKVLALAWDQVPRHLATEQSQDLALTREGKPISLTGWWRALEEVERTVVGDSRKRAREQGFLSFLRRLERRFPGAWPLHLIVDREGTHTQAYAQAWLERRRRFRLHPPPAGGSWLRWAGAWLGELSRGRSLRSLGALEEAIQTYLAGNPAQPQPFAWAGRGPEGALSSAS
ncbi:MAG: IS630 family transposase [Acidobacteria bacterium]|nr:MAG: IS630 family transposase [Acidobacteriota bacterium]